MSIDPLPVSPNQVDSDAMRTKINQLISDNSSVTVGDTPPASPGEGDLWFDESVAAMYVYIAAPTNAWIQTNPASTGGSGGSQDTFTQTFNMAETRTILYTSMSNPGHTGLPITHNLNSQYLEFKFWFSHNHTVSNVDVYPTTYLSKNGILYVGSGYDPAWTGPHFTPDPSDLLNKGRFKVGATGTFGGLGAHTDKGLFELNFQTNGVAKIIVNAQYAEIDSSLLMVTKYQP